MKKLIFSILFILLITSGCINTIKQKSSDDKIDAETLKPSYLNFPDVLIPVELKKNREGTLINRNSNVISGILTLTGRADAGFLIDFFKENMGKDNWVLVSENETSQRMILMFKKKCRWSIINIQGSKVTIWVTPNSSISKGTGLLK